MILKSFIFSIEGFECRNHPVKETINQCNNPAAGSPFLSMAEEAVARHYLPSLNGSRYS